MDKCCAEPVVTLAGLEQAIAQARVRALREAADLIDRGYTSKWLRIQANGEARAAGLEVEPS